MAVVRLKSRSDPVRLRRQRFPARERRRQVPRVLKHPERELIPRDASELQLHLEGRTVQLTNLQKLFWPELGITKGDLLRY